MNEGTEGFCGTWCDSFAGTENFVRRPGGIRDHRL